MSDDPTPEMRPVDLTPPPRSVVIPTGWFVGAHGDPVAEFDPHETVSLTLHPDGSVTWKEHP